MVSLHYLYYNFCRIHQTLRVTPAMAPGVTDTLHDVNWMADPLAPVAHGWLGHGDDERLTGVYLTTYDDCARI